MRLSLVALVLAVLPVAASPRDELLRAVPDDYTFCVVVSDLRGQASGEADAFLPVLTKSPYLKPIREAPEAKRLAEVFETVLKEVGVTPGQLRDEVLGDAVVFVYRKGPPGKPELEDGLLMVQAREEKLLAKLVDRINQAQKDGGELTAVEPVGKHFRRIKAVEGEPADFYALQGNRLVFSQSEKLLTETLDKLAVGGKDKPPVVDRLERLGAATAPVACLVNPRGFDADLSALGAAGQGAEQAFLKHFAGYWRAVDALAVTATFAPHLELGLSLHVRTRELPVGAKRFFATAAQRSPLWDSIPKDALFAAAGRFEVDAFAEMLAGFLSADDRLKVIEGLTDAARPFLESDDLTPLLKGLGPDVGLWVMPPDAGFTPRAVLAAKVAPGEQGAKAEEAALRGMDFAARLACLSDKQLRIHTDKTDGIEVRYLTHAAAFPDEFRPGFASKGGYLVVGTSPQAIRGFAPPTSPATDMPEVPIVRLNVDGLRSYLQTHRKELVPFLAKKDDAEAARINEQLDAVLPMLDGMGDVELVQRSSPDRVTFLLRLKSK